jgi:dsRNA-specific ribonuclease
MRAQEQEPIMDMASSVRHVESLLGYRFKNKSLLEDALTHPSYTGSESYERLEFVGDAALGLAMSNFAFLTYRNLEPGQLTLLRAANVSTEKLARVAVRHKLYKYVRHNASALRDKVLKYVIEVEEEESYTEIYGGAVKAPKVLADIVESIAAALYIDSDFNLKILWLHFRGLLEPIITPDILDHQPQPVTQLFELSQREGKQVNIENWRKGDKNIASVYIDGKLIASGSSDKKEGARIQAAKAALLKIPYSTNGEMNFAQVNENNEIDSAKQKLHKISGKKRWSTPEYRIEKEVGAPHEKKYICTCKIETSDKILFVSGQERRRVKDAENSAASMMFCGLYKSKYL